MQFFSILAILLGVAAAAPKLTEKPDVVAHYTHNGADYYIVKAPAGRAHPQWPGTNALFDGDRNTQVDEPDFAYW